MVSKLSVCVLNKYMYCSQWASYLPLLVDDGHCVLQLDVVEQAGQEDVSHADQRVVLLLVEERVGTFEVGPHHLGSRENENNLVRLRG